MTDDARDYAIMLVPLAPDDGGGWLGFVPDLPGCMGDGQTRAEALADTEAAMIEWLEAQAARGEAPPVPGEAMRAAEDYDAMMRDAVRALAELVDRSRDEARQTAEQNRRVERQLAELIAVLKEDRAQPVALRPARLPAFDAPRRPRH